MSMSAETACNSGSVGVGGLAEGGKSDRKYEAITWNVRDADHTLVRSARKFTVSRSCPRTRDKMEKDEEGRTMIERDII